MDNAEIRAQARAYLTGKWNITAMIWLVYMILLSISSSLAGLVTAIIEGPLLLGLTIISLRIVRSMDINVEMLFAGFSDFSRSLIAYLLMALYIVLWTLLLIIPGIVASLSYSMTYFILADNPHIAPSEAITRSKNMMNGHKMELFLLNLSFIGWMILSLFTFGLGFLWLGPYMRAATAIFYQNIRGDEVGAFDQSGQYQ